MPTPGKRWRHVIINTRCSWLHGDPRGFRNRDHRIHSSGDYKNPPPEGEHEGLHRYHQARAGEKVDIPEALRPPIGRAIVGHFQSEGMRLLSVAVSNVHAHALVELPDRMDQIRRVVGHAKRKSSRAVKKELPGSIWSEGGKYKQVNSRSHQQSAFEYILYDQGPDAWTWSYKDGSHGGQFGRKRPDPEHR